MLYLVEASEEGPLQVVEALMDNMNYRCVLLVTTTLRQPSTPP